MKKFAFQLEKLLNYKDQVLDSEMMTLAELNNKLTEVQNQLFMLVRSQEQCSVEFESLMQQETDPATCRTYAIYKDHLREQIKHTRTAIDVIMVQVNKQIEVVRKVKLETKTLETIKASRYDEYQKEDRKITEKDLEEYVSTEKIMRKSVRS